VREKRDVAAEVVEREAKRLRAGTEGTLVVRSLPPPSTIAQSVKVPPMSMPT
jgi:hypothetical protein